MKIVALGILFGLLAGMLAGAIRNVAHGRDLGQWAATDADVGAATDQAVRGATDQAVRAWYKNLKMPDAPAVSCCGEADAYWADSFEVDRATGNYVAIITDDRPDAPRRRPHRDVGQRVVIPNHKIKWNEGNPTGHGVLFIGGNGGIYCYVPPGGV